MAAEETMIRTMPYEYEPKRVNRFFAIFDDALGIQTWKVQKFKRPSMKINSVPIQYMNEQNYARLANMNEIEIFATGTVLSAFKKCDTCHEKNI